MVGNPDGNPIVKMGNADETIVIGFVLKSNLEIFRLCFSIPTGIESSPLISDETSSKLTIFGRTGTFGARVLYEVVKYSPTFLIYSVFFPFVLYSLF